MNIQDYINLKSAKANDFQIKENKTVNFLMKSFVIIYEKIKVSVIYYPVPEYLNENGNESINYIILYPTSYYAKGVYKGDDFKRFCVDKIKADIDNNLETFKMLIK
jgi:hypothetical protein